MTPKNIDPLEAENPQREEWREWLGSHGLPHNEVEGDMILDFIEAIIATAVKSARIEELKRPRSYNLDINFSGHYKDGFAAALDQVERADQARISALNSTEGDV